MGFAATAQIPGELKPYVTLVTSDQPEFRGLVEQLLTPQQLADYAPVLPYGVVIQNISTAPLRGYGVAFVQQPVTDNGRLDTYNAVDNAITPLGMFQPGQSMFHMPGVRLAPPALEPGQTGARVARISPPSASPGGAGLAALAQQLAASSITVSAEFVVTEAGKILGPDNFQDAQNIQAHQKARLDLADRIRSHGNDQAGLIADLQTLAQQKVTNHYTSQLRAKAKTLLMSITKANDPESVNIYLATQGSGIIISR